MVVPIVSFDKVVAIPDKLRLQFLGKAGRERLGQRLGLSAALGSLEIVIMVWSVFDVWLAGRTRGQTRVCFAGRHGAGLLTRVVASAVVVASVEEVRDGFQIRLTTTL